MKIDDNFRIEPDNTGWILIYEKLGEINPKTGKPKRTVEKGYYGSIESALRRYVDLTVHKGPTDSVEAILRSLERVHETITEFSRPPKTT